MFWNKIDPLIEGRYADQYTNENIKIDILSNYEARFPEPTETPFTHPWKFNPLVPPTGWRYDPYYEIWIQETK